MPTRRRFGGRVDALNRCTRSFKFTRGFATIHAQPAIGGGSCATVAGVQKSPHLNVAAGVSDVPHRRRAEITAPGSGGPRE
jgi:hypothetical protein